MHISSGSACWARLANRVWASIADRCCAILDYKWKSWLCEGSIPWEPFVVTILTSHPLRKFFGGYFSVICVECQEKQEAASAKFLLWAACSFVLCEHQCCVWKLHRPLNRSAKSEEDRPPANMSAISWAIAWRGWDACKRRARFRLALVLYR